MNHSVNEEIIEVSRAGGIGDVLMCTPVLRALKRLKPHVKLIFYADQHECVRGLTYIDELLPFSARSNKAVWLGYEENLRKSEGPHNAQLMASRLGIMIEDVKPDCVIDTDLVGQFQLNWKSLPRPWVVINRRASDWTPNKDWHDSLWLKLIQRLDGLCGVIEIGLPKEGVAKFEGKTFVDLVGRTTKAEMIAAIGACDIHVGPMSGPVHVAAAAGKRSVVIHGGYEYPTGAAYPGNEALYSPVECAPCWLQEPCPHQKKCFSQITVDMVEARIWRAWVSSSACPGSLRAATNNTRQGTQSAELIFGELAAPRVLSTTSRLYVAYRPDSDIMYNRHPELRGLVGPWVENNALNNSGDLPRLYTLSLNIKQIIADGVAGDFAELGVYKGNSAATLAHYARCFGRTLFLFDTFTGFNKKDFAGVDSSRRQQFTDTSLDLVLRNTGIASVVCVKGHFPESVNRDVQDRRYSVVHLDCDLYAPMKAGLEFFYPRLSEGGLLIIHDYVNEYWSGIRTAVDEFCQKIHEGIIIIPDKSGTAILRKSRH